MRNKLLVLGIALVMCAIPLMAISDDSTAVPATQTTYAYSKYGTYACVSEDARTYYGGSSGTYPVYYFPEAGGSPYDNVLKFVKGEISYETLMADSVTPDYGLNYYEVVFPLNSGGYDIGYRVIDVTPRLIFLEAGAHTIYITGCGEITKLVIRSADYLSGSDYSSKSIAITDGKGSIKLESNIPQAYLFDIDYSGTQLDWASNPITYYIDPYDEPKIVTDFNRTAKVLSNKQWIRQTSEYTLDGTVVIGNYYSSDHMYYFAEGSEKEKEFVKNVVDMNTSDTTGYTDDTYISESPKPPGYRMIDLNGKRIVAYQCVTMGDYISNNLWVNGKYDPSTHSIDYDAYRNGISIDTEKIPTGETDGSKFYADKGFSIAVDYDTSRFVFVAIKFTTTYGMVQYGPLQPGRLYSFDMKNAAEYEIYGMLKEDATDIGPMEVRFYTEGVPATDNYGLVFAVVAVLLCALAFGTLFYAGMHPKWSDEVGLPDASESFAETSDTADTGPSEEIPGPESDIQEENIKDE